MAEPLPPKKHKPNSYEENSSLATVKRGWQSWSTEEKEVFFRCIKEFGRDFDSITGKIGSKSYEQVRHFYYRIIKKINKILKPNKIDNKDQKEVITALICFWEAKRGITEKEEYTKEFANSLRELISKRMAELQKDESLLGAALMGKKNKKSCSRKQRQSKVSSPSLPSFPPPPSFSEPKREPLISENSNSNSESAIDPPTAIALATEQIHRLPSSKNFGGPLGTLPLLPSLSSLSPMHSSMAPLALHHFSSLSPLPNNSGSRDRPLNLFATGVFATPLNIPNGFSPLKSASLIPKLEPLSGTGENSLPMIEDTSCDSLTNNDVDEIACKNFYNQFENSLQDGLERGETPTSKPKSTPASFKHLFCQ